MIDRDLASEFYRHGYVDGRLDGLRRELEAAGRDEAEIVVMLEQARRSMEALRDPRKPAPDYAGTPAAAVLH